MNVESELLKVVQGAIERQKGTTAYDTTATVVRIDGETAWVHIDGGVDETPVRMTIDAKEGDKVQVRVSGGSAWLTGNATAPPTDDTTAIISKQIATDAHSTANKARETAAYAELEALEARGQAISAIEYAGVAQTAAEEASASATQAANSASQAAEAADAAQGEAQRATKFANNALGQLSEIEKVVDVLTWAGEHGEYSHVPSTETTVVEGKYYFTRSSSQPYTYTVVVNPDGNPYAQDYYQLDGVDAAVSNYIMTHLALTDDGLFVQIDGDACKMQLTGSGINIYDGNGTVIASYGNTIVLGDTSGLHIEQTSGELGFYEGASKVAYINSNKLFITDAELTNSMKIGKYTWKVQDANGDRISLIYTG